MSSSTSYICDYITLFFEDGNITGGVGEWDIPAGSYYYQHRGTMTLISIADAVFAPGTGTAGILVGFENGFNGTTAQEGTADRIKNDLAFLGTFQYSGDSSADKSTFEYNKVEPIKVLTSARPSKLRFHFFKDNKNEFDISEGCLIVKFEYLSPEAEKEINDAVSYVPAFPEPNNF